MRIVEWLIHRKIFILLASLFIMVLGVYTLSQLDKELNPEVGLDGASIQVKTNNTSVNEVEKNITIPLEEQLQSIPGVNEITSTTSHSESSLHVSFDHGKGGDIFPKVETDVHFLLSELPQIEEVKVQQDGVTTAYEFILDVSAGDMVEMTDFANNTLQPRLEKLPEVRDVMITGADTHKVTMTFDESALVDHQLTQQEVIQLMQQMNDTEKLGDVTKKATTIELYWDMTLDDIDDLKALSIPTEQGVTTLGDLAKVTVETEAATADTWKNGSSDVLMIQIARTETASQQAMTHAVRNEIAAIESEGLIEDMTMNEVIAHADFVDDAMGDVTKNIIIGGIIAIVVLLLFLRNLRATIIISVAIPTSILLTMIAMGILDYSMNLLTLIGLGLGIGMMVDSSIVMLEAIYSKKEQGLHPVAAVIAGTKEVASAIIASALTTIVVFLPIGFIGGDSGKYMLMLAIVVAITLISSVIVAFTFIPTLAKDFLRQRKQQNNQGKMLAWYKKMLEWCMEKKRRSFSVVLCFIVLFALSFLLIPKISMNIMPDIFNRYTEVAIDLEHDVNEEEKHSIIEQANEKLQQIDDVEANFLLDLDDVIMASVVMTKGNKVTKEQELVTEEIVRTLRELQTTEPIRAVERALDGVSGYPVQLHIAGDNFSELETVTKAMQTELGAIDGIVGATSDADNFSTIEKVILDEVAMKDAGLTPIQIKQQIEQLLFNEPISNVEWNAETVPVYAMNSSEKDVLQETIPTSNGDKALSTFVSFATEQMPDEITRKNGERYLALMADVEGKDLGTVNKAVTNLIDNHSNEEAYTVSLAGDLEEQQELMNDMLLAIGIAIFLVYVVMAVQFNHFGHPLIVMAIIPVTVIGVILGLVITQADLNMMSGMGIIILIGIVLNNAILLIDRTNQLRKSGTAVVPALIQAGESRIRAIFMTTLTTIGGMLPLALATGMSADYQAPMAIVIISGLLFSTLITLILIPAIYRLCSRG